MVKAGFSTLIRLSGTFSQGEKGFCKLLNEGFDKKFLNR